MENVVNSEDFNQYADLVDKIELLMKDQSQKKMKLLKEMDQHFKKEI